MGLKNYGLITSIDELAQFCERLLAGDGPIGFDIETGYVGPDREKFSVHAETAIVVGISFTCSTDWARYVPLAHDAGVNLDNREVARFLWPVLFSGRGVPHNGSFELRHLSRWFRELLSDDPFYGEQVRGCNGYFRLRSDTLVEAYIAAEHERFGLKPLTKAMFDHTMTELHELFPDLPKNRRRMLRFNVLDQHDPKVFEYACEDSVWALAIHERYYPLVKDRLLYQVEMAIVQDEVTSMEDHGIAYDWAAMRSTGDQLRAFRDKYNAEIMRELGDMLGQPVAINLASPPQVGKLLYEQLGYSTNVYTEKTRDLAPDQRKMSTGKIALAGLAKQHAVVRKIVDWKEQTRLLTTYLDKYEDKYNYAADGRAHPNHLSAFVPTGRFAVSDPPYQGSPKIYHYDLDSARAVHARHAEEHGEKCECDDARFFPEPGTCFKINFRNFITSPPDWYMVGFDLSQAELRAIAGEAQEPELLKAFAEGRDVHTLTAALMLGIPVEQVTKKQRDIGKTMNFALLYGMKEKSLADRLGIPLAEAKALYASYFNVYSRIAAWAAKQVEFARTHGYVTSRFGRRMPIWEYLSPKRWIQQKGDRAAVNYPIQGAATGDFMKIAMVRARKALRRAGMLDRVKLVMNVHDCLEFYVHRSLLPQDVITVLQPAVIFPVPGWPQMQADWHFARRWGSPVNITVTDDGRFLVKSDGEYELKPSIEVDEDTGEVFEVLPDVDPQTLREVVAQLTDDPGAASPALLPCTVRAAAAPSAARETAGSPTMTSPFNPQVGRHLIVELDDMPTEDGYLRFLDLLDTLPGPHTLTLRTPEGDMPVDLPAGTSLGTHHLSQLYLLLGTVRLRFDAADVDPGMILGGLDL